MPFHLSAPEYAALLFTAGCSLTDLQTLEIHLPFCAAFLILGIVSVTGTGQSLLETVISLIPGMILLWTARISRGAVGGGDGVVVLITGLFLGFSLTLASSAAGILLAGCYAGFCLFTGRFNRAAFPFLPFLFAGECLVLLLK